MACSVGHSQGVCAVCAVCMACMAVCQAGIDGAPLYVMRWVVVHCRPLAGCLAVLIRVCGQSCGLRAQLFLLVLGSTAVHYSCLAARLALVQVRRLHSTWAVCSMIAWWRGWC